MFATLRCGPDEEPLVAIQQTNQLPAQGQGHQHQACYHCREKKVRFSYSFCRSIAYDYRVVVLPLLTKSPYSLNAPLKRRVVIGVLLRVSSALSGRPVGDETVYYNRSGAEARPLCGEAKQ